ncbi:hypothetical protein HDU96_010038 [Phlyctochytrium bullatum]|nr:hypothetical protein HDU96_010038 [Phlyctochytrium bullatum]
MASSMPPSLTTTTRIALPTTTSTPAPFRTNLGMNRSSEEIERGLLIWRLPTQARITKPPFSNYVGVNRVFSYFLDTPAIKACNESLSSLPPAADGRVYVPQTCGADDLAAAMNYCREMQATVVPPGQRYVAMADSLYLQSNENFTSDYFFTMYIRTDTNFRDVSLPNSLFTVWSGRSYSFIVPGIYSGTTFTLPWQVFSISGYSDNNTALIGPLAGTIIGHLLLLWYLISSLNTMLFPEQRQEDQADADEVPLEVFSPPQPISELPAYSKEYGQESGDGPAVTATGVAPSLPHAKKGTDNDVLYI